MTARDGASRTSYPSWLPLAAPLGVSDTDTDTDTFPPLSASVRFWFTDFKLVVVSEDLGVRDGRRRLTHTELVR